MPHVLVIPRQIGEVFPMEPDERPDPDALLEEIGGAESGGGRLKIFLGMCPGVGKTFAMLLAGQTRQEEGAEVAIGVLETHGRVETAAIAAGIFRVPLRKSDYRGIVVGEMDLDALLARKPQLALVDELAHSNAAGSRHPKRWQDVTELLRCGIDVYTTLNIQHIESQRDVVARITGVPVHETIPDSVIDLADEIELIDLTPEELRKRLEEGKVYLGDRAAAASSNFFREGNLKALREIALRVTAEKADRDLRRFMRSRRISGPWRSRERFLVAVGGSPYSERLIRLARRAASAVHGTWIAVSVDLGSRKEPAGEARLESNLALARSLGAEVILTSGTSVAGALLRVARENNVTQIIVGKPLGHPLLEWLRGGSPVSRLIRESGEIDVTVVRADRAAKPWRPDFREIGRPPFLRELGIGAAAVIGTTALGMALQPAIGYTTVGLLYLFAVLVCAASFSRAATFAMAALTACSWNFLFIPPTFTFRIGGAHDTVLFGLYFVVALVTGQLHSRLRDRERAERHREQQTLALYQFARILTEKADFSETMESAIRRLGEIFSADFCIFLAGEDGRLAGKPIAGAAVNDRERAVAEWVLQHGEMAGRNTDTLPLSAGFYTPLRATEKIVGVAGAFAGESRNLSFEERQMLGAFCSQLALVVESRQLQDAAARSEVEERSRHLQKSLLDSVSHELRTPLAVISVSAERLTASIRDEEGLLGEISSATRRLERLVSNLLDLTRLESGAVRPKPEWCDLEEIIGEAIDPVRKDAPSCEFRVKIEASANLIFADAGLLEEAVRNLVRNAAQHTAKGTPVEIDAREEGGEILIRVSDHGSGIRPEDREVVFEKFYRGPSARPGGLGMGLALVRGFLRAMGGRADVCSREDGSPGSVFVVRFPARAGALP